MRYGITFASLFTLGAAVFVWTGDMHDPAAPERRPPVELAAPATTTPATTTTSTTTTTTEPVLPIIYPPAPDGARCPQWWTLAQQAGWTYEDLETALDIIMWRESRCTAEVRSSTSDSGLLQINDIHRDHLAGLGITPEMLFDPFWNLVAGLEVARLAESYGWHRFQPWAATYP